MHADVITSPREKNSCEFIDKRRQAQAEGDGTPLLTAMRHLIDTNIDGTRVVHYSPSTETVSVYKLPSKPHHSSHLLSPTETLSARASLIHSLSIHPTLPIVLAISSNGEEPISNLPRGPSSLATSASAVAQTVPKMSKSRVMISVLSYNSRPMSKTPLFLDLPSDTEFYPHCLRFSRCGNYLALNTRPANKENSNKIHILDVQNKYTLIKEAVIGFSIEDMVWSYNSRFLICACSDGKLRVVDFQAEIAQVEVVKTLNLSSAPLSCISYTEKLLVDNKWSQNGLLVGSRDGNTYFVDPTTLTCTYSEVVPSSDFPVLSVSLGPSNLAVVTYQSPPPDQVKITKIPTDDVDCSIPTDDHNAIEDMANVLTTGCGMFFTPRGILVYVGNDEKAIFRVFGKKKTTSEKNDKNGMKKDSLNRNLKSKVIPRKRGDVELFEDTRSYRDKGDSRDRRDRMESRGHRDNKEKMDSRDSRDGRDRYWDRNKRFKGRQNR